MLEDPRQDQHGLDSSQQYQVYRMDLAHLEYIMFRIRFPHHRIN